MPGRYAEGTSVSVVASRAEVSRILERYGADQRVVGDDDQQIVVRFRLQGRQFSVPVQLPPRREFRSIAAHEREVRRLWRVLILLLKGRLELVAEGVESAEQAFLPYLMLPGGGTVGQEIGPAIAEAYASGAVPSSLLPSLAAPGKVIALGEGRR